MLIILGPPGAGKGTQARMVSEFLGIQYVSAGDNLKNKLKDDTQLMEKIHSGQIIEDVSVNSFITELAHSMESNSIFEGFPRTENQCKYLLTNLDHKKVHGVVILDVKQETVVDRLCKRYVCPNCHKPDNSIIMCCNMETIKRIDDKDIKAIKQRLDIFSKNIEKIKNAFLNHNIKIVHIDGELSKNQIKNNIVNFYNQVMTKG